MRSQSHPTDEGAAAALRPIRLLNVDIDDVTTEELLEKRDGTIITIHVDMMAKLQKDKDFYDVVQKFDVVTCDSQILFFAAKAMGLGLRERVSGSDFFPRFYTRWADDPSVTIFLLGAMNDIAARAAEVINAKVGREIVVGAYGPSVGIADDPDEINDVVKMVEESKATVLVFGLEAGKQERFLMAVKDRLPGVRLFLPLGGTIDYEAGAVKRPPPIITRIGLEWFWRLAREPKRRWRRYLVHQPPVLYHLARQAAGRYRDPFAD
ncbi:MAG: WecB/TagA/CpsF family glycosyltransferase [Acidimicrobiales bacterium]